MTNFTKDGTIPSPFRHLVIWAWIGRSDFDIRHFPGHSCFDLRHSPVILSWHCWGEPLSFIDIWPLAFFASAWQRAWRRWLSWGGPHSGPGRWALPKLMERSGPPPPLT